MNDLRALRAFVRVVETGSFSAAARELRVEQSTVSKWVAALERDLGLSLLERTTRSQRLTDAGERLLGHARDVLGTYDDAMAQMREISPELRGRVRLSVPVVFGQRYLVGPLRSFLASHPHVEMEVVFADRYARLVEENLDAAVRVGQPVDSSDRAIALGGTGRKLVASPSYVEARGAPRRPADLKEHDCLTHTGFAATWTLRRGKRASRVGVRGRFAANHSATLLAMAIDGHGVAMLADWLVDEPLARGELVQLLEGYSLPPAPIHALVPPKRHVAPRVRALLEHLRDALRPRFSDAGSRRARS